MLAVARKRRRWRYFASVPERTVRAGAAGLGGTLHESFELTLPRFVRRSRLYEVTAKNLLRVMIELVGGVEGSPTVDPDADAGEIAKRKVAGNVVEVGSIAAFGFSPLWLLAAAADLTHGSRVYLSALEDELKAAGVIDEDVDAHSVDELLGVLEGTSGETARLVDIPPLELKELRASLAELRSQAESMPSPSELAALFVMLRRTAAAENRSLLEVSAGVGLAFLTSARKVSGRDVVAPYREDWKPLQDEGLAAYARRVGGPYRRAISRHLDAGEASRTERLIDWVDGRRRKVSDSWSRVAARVTRQPRR